MYFKPEIKICFQVTETSETSMKIEARFLNHIGSDGFKTYTPLKIEEKKTLQCITKILEMISPTAK